MVKKAASLPDKFEGLEPLVRELYVAGNCEKFGLAADEFSAILEKIATKYLPATFKEETSALSTKACV